MKGLAARTFRSHWFPAALLGLLILPSVVLAFQEEEVPTAALGALGVMLAVMFIIFAAFYVYISLSLQTIAKKTNTPNAWLAWIPIINIFLMLNIAKKPAWWFILCLIPLVNIVIVIIVWMAIAEARGKPSWWGILVIVPFVNLIVPGYLAFSD